ncbi:MAG: NUDIX domain-containing protein [Clostridia bacterium]|nr:NUDIX domain-containing protein [Clostridia bacterium]
MGYISELRKTVGHRTLIMPCSAVIIEDGRGNILLQKRVDDGKWGYHGGAIEIDESAEDALRREVREELNIEMDELRLQGVYSGPSYHHIYPNGDETSCIDIVYICGKYHGEMRLQPEEVREVAWFDRAHLPEQLSGSCRQPILDYFDGLSERPLP